jgi:flagellar basal-body rod protein FlgB
MIDALFQNGNYQLARQMLDAAVLRHQALASNIANAETPGYKRVDLAPDFATQLQAALQRGEDPAHAVLPKIVEDPTARSARPDGNNVEIERELQLISTNNTEHNFLTQVISTNLRNLRTAISGRSG